MKYPDEEVVYVLSLCGFEEYCIAQGLAVCLFDNTFATAMQKTKHTKRTNKQNFSQEEV
ncbi:MAG: hypothetical protein V4676_05090 [Bacteroidota bacterium]